MEPRFINRNKKCLRIGDFTIGISGSRTSAKAMIPYAGMAFYQPKENSEQIRLCLEPRDAEYPEERRVIWGSDELSPITYVYETEGETEWVLYNSDHEVMMDTHISKDWSDFTISAYNYDDDGEMLFR